MRGRKRINRKEGRSVRPERGSRAGTYRKRIRRTDNDRECIRCAHNPCNRRRRRTPDLKGKGRAQDTRVGEREGQLYALGSPRARGWWEGCAGGVENSEKEYCTWIVVFECVDYFLFSSTCVSFEFLITCATQTKTQQNQKKDFVPSSSS